MGDGKASPADRAEVTAPAGLTSPAVCPGRIRVIDLLKGGVKNMANGRGEFPAGVDLAFGQKGDKVEGGAASEPCASAEQGLFFFPANDVDQVVFETQHGVFPGRFFVLP